MRESTRIMDVVLKALGLLLVIAAILKGHQLVTEPLAGKDFWSWRPLLILQVELELALGIWLLSGLFKRPAWLASLLCFSLFSCVTLYKALTGAASCGCFGTVHVNPWLTLAGIDLPAVLALSLFRPARTLASVLAFLRRRQSVGRVVRELLHPMPSWPRCAATGILGMAVLGLAIPILAVNKPALATSAYEVLEPKTWIGKELPILEYIDIAEQLEQGAWLVVLYHYNCPNCARTIPRFEQMARDLAGKGDLLRVALIGVPPHAPGRAGQNSPCVLGKLPARKEWFVTTPAVILTWDTQVEAAWEGEAPDLATILAELSRLHKKVARMSIPLPCVHSVIAGSAYQG